MTHAGGHHQQRDGRGDAEETLTGGFPGRFARAGDQSRADAADDEEQAGQRQGQVGEDFHEWRGDQHGQNEGEEDAQEDGGALHAGIVAGGEFEFAVFQAFGLIFLEDRRGFRFAVSLFGIGGQEYGKNCIDYDEEHETRPRAGEEWQAGEFVRHADGEGIEDRRRKADVGRQHRHAQASQRVPAKRVSQCDHDRHERDDFLEDAEEDAQRHEEESDDEQQGVLAPAEFLDDLEKDVFENAAFVHHAEGRPDQQDEDDDANDGHVIFGGEDLKRRGEPAPEGIIGPLSVHEGVSVNRLAPVHLDACVTSRRDDAGQDASDSEQGRLNAVRAV